MGETAQRLGLSQDTVREWVRRGFLKARRTPTGQLLFDEADVEAARRGDRPGAAAPPPAGEPTLPSHADAGEQMPGWKRLPPWQTKVEAARASITLDELEAERKAKTKARENEAQRAALMQRQTAQEEAQRQRLSAIKIRVIRTVWIPAECLSEVIEAIERFAIPERIPSWLSEEEQFDLVATHARTIVQEERAKAEQRRNAEYEQQREEFAAQLAAAREPKDSPPPSSPQSVAEALRRRGITDE